MRSGVWVVLCCISAVIAHRGTGAREKKTEPKPVASHFVQTPFLANNGGREAVVAASELDDAIEVVKTTTRAPTPTTQRPKEENVALLPPKDHVWVPIRPLPDNGKCATDYGEVARGGACVIPLSRAEVIAASNWVQRNMCTHDIVSALGTSGLSSRARDYAQFAGRYYSMDAAFGIYRLCWGDAMEKHLDAMRLYSHAKNTRGHGSVAPSQRDVPR